MRTAGLAKSVPKESRFRMTSCPDFVSRLRVHGFVPRLRAQSIIIHSRQNFRNQYPFPPFSSFPFSPLWQTTVGSYCLAVCKRQGWWYYLLTCWKNLPIWVLRGRQSQNRVMNQAKSSQKSAKEEKKELKVEGSLVQVPGIWGASVANRDSPFSFLDIHWTRSLKNDKLLRVEEVKVLLSVIQTHGAECPESIFVHLYVHESRSLES